MVSVRSFRINIPDIDIDWTASLNIIMKEFKDGISNSNNEQTAYNLKNYLEILSTLSLLNQRNPELYKRSRCCRCNVMIETWTHIWICKENDTSMTQIIKGV